jgi:hypothetical protein
MASKQAPKPRKAVRAETPAVPDVSAPEVRRRIEIEAYYRAEARGFAPGRELDDWVAAEAEVRRSLEQR